MRFLSPEESFAWSVFFAAQTPKITPPLNKKELDVAASVADEMLEQWRARRLEAAPTEEKKDEEPKPRRGRRYG